MNEPRGNGRNYGDENRPSWRPSDQSMRDYDPRFRDDDQQERMGSQRDDRFGGYQERQPGYQQDYRHQGGGQYPYGGGSREWGAGHHQSYGQQSYGQRDRGYGQQGVGDRYGHEQDWNQQGSQQFRHLGQDERWGQDYQRGGYGEDRYGRSYYSGGRWGENRGMNPMMGRGYSGSGDESFDDRGYSRRMGFDRNYGEGNRMGSGMGMGSGGFGGGGMDVGRREGSLGGGYGQQEGLGHRGKGPKNFQRSDERIKERVSEALQDDDDIDASEIEVEVKNGEVILKGTVDDRRQKRAAEECIERIPGVNDVQNQIKVGGNKWQVTSRGNQSGQGGVGTQDSDKKHRA